MSFSNQKARFPILICPINDGAEHAVISSNISSKSVEVSEVVNILPRMENIIHNMRVIAIQKFIYFGQQPANALLVNCLSI